MGSWPAILILFQMDLTEAAPPFAVFEKGGKHAVHHHSDALGYTAITDTNCKMRPAMATSSAKQKSAMDKLLDTFAEVIDSGAQKMTPRELRESEKNFNAALDRAVAARKRPRETA